MIFALLLATVSAFPRFGPGYVTSTTTQDPNTPTCIASETYIGVDETTTNPQFCPAYNKNCRNMYPTTAAGGTACHYSCTSYLNMRWCYTEDCEANPTQPCAWGWCMLNGEQNCPQQPPPIPQYESCPFICSAYAGVPGEEVNCGGEGVLEVGANCARVFEPMVRMTDEELPYLVNPTAQKGHGTEAAAAWFNFKCCEDVASFEIEMDVLMIGGGANSFWVFVDDQRRQFGWRMFSTLWQWARVPHQWEVQAGCHNLIVDDREPGTKVRSVRLIGEAAEKCHFSAHTAEGGFDSETAVGFKTGPGWDASGEMAAAFRKSQEVGNDEFMPLDYAVYGFAAVGAASILFYAFKAVVPSQKYDPINENVQPEYGA